MKRQETTGNDRKQLEMTGVVGWGGGRVDQTSISVQRQAEQNERKLHETTGQVSSRQESTGLDKLEQVMKGQDRSGQVGTGQVKTENDRTGKNR